MMKMKRERGKMKMKMKMRRRTSRSWTLCWSSKGEESYPMQEIPEMVGIGLGMHRVTS